MNLPNEMQDIPDQSPKKPIGLMIGSIISSIIALGLIPPLFGGLAIFLGFQAYKRDTGIGQICMGIGGVAMLAGFIIGFIIGAENIRL